MFYAPFLSRLAQLFFLLWLWLVRHDVYNFDFNVIESPNLEPQNVLAFCVIALVLPKLWRWWNPFSFFRYNGPYLGDSMTESLVHTRPLQSLLGPASFRIYDYFKCLFAEDIPCHCVVIFCPLIKSVHRSTELYNGCKAAFYTGSSQNTRHHGKAAKQAPAFAHDANWHNKIVV